MYSNGVVSKNVNAMQSRFVSEQYFCHLYGPVDRIVDQPHIVLSVQCDQMARLCFWPMKHCPIA